MLDGDAYRPFNMVVADDRYAFWIRNLGNRAEGGIRVRPIAAGVSMLTAWDLDDTEASDRTRLYLPRFRAAPAPRPAEGDWDAWAALLAGREIGRAACKGKRESVRVDLRCSRIFKKTKKRNTNDK